MRIPSYFCLLSASLPLSSTLDAANVQSSYSFDDYYKLEADIENYTGADIPPTITITGNGNTIVDGNTHHGFQIWGTNAAHEMTHVTISGIAEFTGFTDSANSTDNTATYEGGAALLFVAGSHLEFKGYDENNRITFSNNTVHGNGLYVEGGALVVAGGSSVGDIYADFHNNAVYLSESSSPGSYARGGQSI